MGHDCNVALHTLSRIEDPMDNNRRASNVSSEVEDGKKDALSDGVLPSTKLLQQQQQQQNNFSRKKCSLI